MTPYDRRALVVGDDELEVVGPGERLKFDLRDGLLLVGESTMTIVDGEDRLQLRALDPPSFAGIDWPDDVRERIDEQRARSAAARAQLRRQLSTVVAGTIAGLTLLLLVLVIVLLAA